MDVLNGALNASVFSHPICVRKRPAQRGSGTLFVYSNRRQISLQDADYFRAASLGSALDTHRITTDIRKVGAQMSRNRTRDRGKRRRYVLPAEPHILRQTRAAYDAAILGYDHNAIGRRPEPFPI